MGVFVLAAVPKCLDKGADVCERVRCYNQNRINKTTDVSTKQTQRQHRQSCKQHVHARLGIRATNTHIHTNTHTLAHMHTCTHARTCTHTHTHTHTHACPHTHTQSPPPPLCSVSFLLQSISMFLIAALFFLATSS